MKLIFRTWVEFFDKRQFNQPDTRTLQDRVSSNLVYYAANYLAVVALFLLYVCWTRPWFLVAIASSVGGGYYLFALRRGPLVVGTRLVTRRETILLFTTLTALAFLVTGGLASLVTLALAAAAILVHASLHEKNPAAAGAAGGTTFVDAFSMGGIGHGKKFDGDGPASPGGGGARGLDDIENPTGAPDDGEEKSKQQEYRQEFRAQMRAKYLRKKD